MRRSLLLSLLVACGGAREPSTTGAISDVVVVLKGSAEPLPFDPRGSRITVVTREIERTIGHPIVLELDTALSPELKASLEETVLASFETLARELVMLRRDDPEVFARARVTDRVVCTYDVLLKHPKAELKGTTVAVRSPPDRFPLLERGLFSAAIHEAYAAELEARWGNVDPRQLSARDQAPYFDYMTKTRPGAGYLWSASRRGRNKDADVRLMHVGRILTLASVVQDPALAARVRHFLVEMATYMGGASPSATRSEYGAWLTSAPLDDADRLSVARVVFSRDAAFPDFDRLGFGLAGFDGWVKRGEPDDAFSKEVFCPAKPRFEAATSIHFSCGKMFPAVLENEKERRRLADVIVKRRDPRLLEVALLEGSRNDHAVELLEAVGDEALFHHGFRVLFHDHARQDGVRSGLEKAAPHWWRDAKQRRGMALLVIARRSEGLDPRYGDNQWTRFVAEFGGPVRSDVFDAFLGEGPRAVEQIPKMWPALVRGAERDDAIARALPVILDRHGARATLVHLRKRYCEEKNAAGLATARASIERWARSHPADAATVSNALSDYTLARCSRVDSASASD